MHPFDRRQGALEAVTQRLKATEMRLLQALKRKNTSSRRRRPWQRPRKKNNRQAATVRNGKAASSSSKSAGTAPPCVNNRGRLAGSAGASGTL